MTCIVAVSDGRRVVVGGDSAATSLDPAEIYSLATPKVFRTGRYVVGFTASYRVGQILRYQTEWPDPPEEVDELERFLATRVVENVRRALRAGGAGRVENGAELGGYFLIAVGGAIFSVGYRYDVGRLIEPYAAIGSGRLPAYGALHATADSGRPLEDRARAALQAAHAFNPTVREPFHLVATG
jgi:ATP-dependent protease HslVU (ClpYQ) peptidase subunit